MAPSDQPFALHAGIDAAELRDVFERDGWVQIHPFLTDAGAERLREHVEQRDDWTVALQMDDKPQVEFDRERWDALNPNQRKAIQKLAAPTQESGFRYLFEQIVAVGNDLKEREPSSLLGQFARFLSSESLLGLVRQITGNEISVAPMRARRGTGRATSSAPMTMRWRAWDAAPPTSSASHRPGVQNGAGCSCSTARPETSSRASCRA